LRRVIISPEAQPAKAKGRLRVFWSPKWQRWIAQSYPTSNGGDTPLRAASRAQFTAAVAAIKYATGDEVAAAYAATKNTRFLPRDALMLAYFGKLVGGADGTGSTILGVIMAQDEIDVLLGSISDVDGVLYTMLSGQVVAISPGSPSQVLTMNPGTGLPAWIDSGGSGSGGPSPYWPSTPATPSLTDFTIRSQSTGTYSATQATRGVTLTAQGASGNRMTMAEQPLTSAVFDMQCLIMPTVPPIYYSAYGIFMRASATDKIITFNVGAGTSYVGLGWQHWTNINTPDISGTFPDFVPSTLVPLWFRAKSDGTTVNNYISTDGENWQLIDHFSYGGFTGPPDKIGFFVNANQQGHNLSVQTTCAALCMAFDIAY